MNGPHIALIWAEAEGGVIGRNGVMPWNVPEDFARFKKLTLGSPVIMGRKTWESLPPRSRPLPDRQNIVVTRQSQWRDEGADAAPSIANALALAASTAGPDGTIWVIGGSEVYAAVIGQADRLEVTEIRAHFEGDVHSPAIGDGWSRAFVDPVDGWHESRSGLGYRFVTYVRAGAQRA